MWRIWVDTGGTFTDCLAVDPEGSVSRAKVLTASCVRGRITGRPDDETVEVELARSFPDDFFAGYDFAVLGGEGTVEVTASESGGRLSLAGALPGDGGEGRCELRSPEEAPVLAARILTGTGLGEELPPASLRLATTRGTNALLERRGGRTALFITEGFSDLLAIGTQQRPELFSLRVERPAPLHERVVEVPGRLDAGGEELEPLETEELAETAASLLEEGFEAAAVALLHSYRSSEHEEALAERLRELGFRHVSLSSTLAPLIRLLPRAETTVVDAYLSPVIAEYLQGVAGALEEGRVHVMTSAGGLSRADGFRSKDSLLSGPAGGVVGAAAAGRRSGEELIIAFDMGGTSTDVSRFDGEHEYRFETRVGDARLLAPALAIETVAAGGGSICHFDGRQLKLGPESAGASPGPACYGSGGPLTLTDVNLLLGRLAPDRFEIPIDVEAAERAAEELVARVAEARQEEVEREELLAGWLDLANERMADAIRQISVRRGYDPREYALVAFGGAGGQHATGVAELLGMETVLVPADAGLLSAHGLGQARLERFVERQVLERLEELEGGLAERFQGLAEEAVQEVRREGAPEEEIELRRRLLSLRFVGQDATLDLEWEPGCEVEAEFRSLYRERFGYQPEGKRVEVESMRVVVSTREPEPLPTPAPSGGGDARPREERWAHFGGWREVPVFLRRDLGRESRVEGPALVFEAHCATVVEPGWRLEVDEAGALRLRRESGGEADDGGDGGDFSDGGRREES